MLRFPWKVIEQIWQEKPGVHLVRFKGHDDLVEGMPNDVSCKTCKSQFKPTGETEKLDYGIALGMEYKCGCGSRISIVKKGGHP